MMCILTFVHDDVGVPLDGVRVVDKPLQEDARRHKGNLGHTLCAPTLHPHVVADSLTDTLP